MFHDVTGLTAGSVQSRRILSVVGVVLHTSNGTDSLRWLQGASAEAGSKASADFLIARNGDTYRIIRSGWYGYHAGQSRWGEWSGDKVNQRFIGIELENADDMGQSPTPEQYQSLGALLTQLRNDKELPFGYILTTHAAIALPLRRKCDPVRFDFNMIIWPH